MPPSVIMITMDEKNAFARQKPKGDVSSDKTLPVSGTHDDMDKLEVMPSSGEDAEGAEDAAALGETVYPGGLRLLLLAVALCLAIFLVALDTTIIATAIPQITDQFHSLSDVGWYGSAYLLTTASFQLFFGKLYTLFPIKIVFLGAIALFEIGSLICGVAAGSVTLIVGRAIAGIGSAGVFSGAYLLIATSVPLAQRPTFTGLIGAMYGISSVVGPLLGGVFTDKITWRWCFYVNLPIGGLAMAVIVFFFTPVPQAGVVDTNSLAWREKLEQFDIPGTIFFLPGVLCLLIALQWGGSKYPWSNGRIIVLFVVFCFCILAFATIQFWRPQQATVSPLMLRKRSVWAAACFAFFMGSAFFTLVYYIPIWFQVVKGVSAYESGIRNIPILLAVVVGTIFSGAGTTNLGYYTPFMIASTILTSIGAGLLTTWDLDTSSKKWIGYQILAGIGIGLGLQIPLIAVQAVLDMSEIPIATALVIFMQLFGASIFVSAGNSVLTNRVINYISKNIPDVDAVSAVDAGATNIRNIIPAKELQGVLEVYNDALTQVFEIALVMACLTTIGSAAMEWKSIKGKKLDVAAAA
ncbi:major facilitator superfamily domain-containing protein [Bisporella sp. PMI_857]|nr:major facilitator superfamily domain-containing protein [Bisporella sp. PMI_857]